MLKHRTRCLVAGAILSAIILAPPGAANAQSGSCSSAKYSDSHFHLTNYIQEGTDARDYLKMMGTVVCRSTMFGIPLQQAWNYANTGDFAPWYYLQTDAPLYYYSFVDAMMAMSYKSLTPQEQARIDPMITGFNPTDMYAADHIARVLLDVPRRVFRDRGIHDPQGVRVVEGSGRRGDPERPRARPTARLCGGGGPCGDSAQRRRHAVPEAEPAGVYRRSS